MSIEKLLKLDVGKHTEKKGNLTYLSWAWAWAEAIKADPAATFEVQMFDGKPFVDINKTAMVFVTVTIFGKPMTCQLPVMDYKNKAILAPDAFAVNTAIMRCMTKALSLHGLGLYIYAGEDLPEETEEGVKKKGDAPVISPRGGIGDDLSDDIKSHLVDLSLHCTELVESDQAKEAYELIENENLDSDQKIWLWNQMPASTRSKIKAVKGK